MSHKFDHILNFRDVGKTVNDFLGKKVMREGVLYRSARPDDASLEDRRKLVEDYGIRTVMDLRTKTEHLKQAGKRQADLKVPALVQSNAALSEPVQIPGLKYATVNIAGKSLETFLISQLTWLGYLKMIVYYLCGYRIRAIRVMSQEVLLPRGLTGMTLANMDSSGADIAEALQTMIDPASLPILVHCTQGKDRTGLIIAVTLMTLDVPSNAIFHDYMLTQQELLVEKDSRLAEIEEIGLTPEWGDCAADFIEKIQMHIQRKYGGVNEYLDSIGFRELDRQRLVEALGT